MTNFLSRLLGGAPQNAWPPEPPPRSQERQSLTSIELSCAAQRSVIGAGAKTAIVAAQLKAATATVDRPPVDVVCVLDRSGSMGHENKLGLCTETIRLLMNELSKAGDRFGLVTFDQQVRTETGLRPLGRRQNKDKVGSALAKLRAGGTTNLSGGIFQGIDEMRRGIMQDDDDVEASPDSDDARPRVRACLVLTDGHANVGVRDPAALVKLTGEALADCPDCALYTFGYGSDHDATLLRDIAGAAGEGKGGYYFVEASEGVIGAFADCLGGLLSVVAQHVVVQVGSDAPIRRVRRTGAERVDEKHWRVPLGDLFAEENRDIVVELDTAGQSQIHVTFDLRFVDVPLSKMSHSTATTSLSIVPAGDARLDAVEEDMHIAAQLLRLDVAETLSAARSHADSGRLDHARVSLKACRDLLEANMQGMEEHCSEVGLIQRLRFDVDECLKNVATKETYERKGKMQMTSKLMGHQQQRCLSDSESDDDENVKGIKDKSEALSARSRNFYRSAAKKRTKASWMSKRAG